MQGIQGIQLSAVNKPRPPGPKHDSLHMAEGLAYCWCNCPKCFLSYAGDHGGICICRECPCQSHYNARSPMYVRATTPEVKQ